MSTKLECQYCFKMFEENDYYEEGLGHVLRNYEHPIAGPEYCPECYRESHGSEDLFHPNETEEEFWDHEE